MGTMTSGDDLHDAALLARECAIMTQAVALARWIRSGRRPVTPMKVLRKSDVPPAAAMLGVRMPERLRTASDLPGLHHPWCVAVAAGLLRVADGAVTAGPAIEAWPPADALVGLRAVCREESGAEAEEDSAIFVVLALLETLRDADLPHGSELWDAVLDAADELCDEFELDWAVVAAAQAKSGQARLVTLLSGFGAVTGDPGKPVITTLGRWAAEQLRDALPGLDEDLAAAEMIAEVADLAEAGRAAAWEWLEERDPVAAAREILQAAETMSPRLRGVAADVVEMLGQDALPAWREMLGAPCVGPHARYALYAEEAGPEPSEADWLWLAVESAAAGLEERGPDEALSRIWESVPGDSDLNARLAVVRATGHPSAKEVARAVAGFVASGAPLSVNQGLQLKVALKYARPPIWRSVVVPSVATLGDLHSVIQVLFGWDGDHLHAFSVERRSYIDPGLGLEETADEDEMRLRDATAGGAKIGYEYDFGASWMHEITLQKTVELDPDGIYPVCVAFKGDSPVEYQNPDEPEEPEPFSLTEVNRRLAALRG